MADAITIAHNHDLTSMVDRYEKDKDLSTIFSILTNGILQEPFSLNKGFLMHESRLCTTKNLHKKVMFESHSPPYAGHRGIQATTQAIETYFYQSSMKKDIQDYVTECIVCQKVKYVYVPHF